MMIMPSNNGSGIFHYLVGKYPDKIGWLLNPKQWQVPPFYVKYAIDNGCFKEWNEERFYYMLRRATLVHKPLWVVVPDVVADAENTLKRWHEHKDKVSAFGYNLAFACQDGHEPQDVPKETHCCFIGGSTEWKIKNAEKFKGVAKLLHIGRVNTINRLTWAEQIGADSVDGTGFFRARDKKYYDFINYFEGSRQIKLFN